MKQNALAVILCVGSIIFGWMLHGLYIKHLDSNSRLYSLSEVNEIFGNYMELTATGYTALSEQDLILDTLMLNNVSKNFSEENSAKIKDMLVQRLKHRIEDINNKLEAFPNLRDKWHYKKHIERAEKAINENS